MKNRTFRLLSVCVLLFISTLMSYSQLSKLNSLKDESSKCKQYVSSLDAKEKIILQRLDEGKPGSAEMNLTAYKKKLEELKAAHCPMASKYEKRALELESMIQDGTKNGACKKIEDEMIRLSNQIESSIARGGTGFVIADDYIISYKKKLREYEENKCVGDVSGYTANVSDWEKRIKNGGVAEDPYKYYIEAIKANDVQKIDEAFANGLKLNGFYGNGENVSPLMAAIIFGKKDIVGYILSKGADINLKNKDGETPLDKCVSGVALTNVEVSIAEYLLSKGANLNVSNYSRIGASAANGDYTSLIKRLEEFVTFSSKNYVNMYWESTPKSECRKYLASCIKTRTIGKRFSDYKNMISDPELLAKMNGAISSSNSAGKYEKMVIGSKDWSISRHNLTGIILGRSIVGYAYFINEDGLGKVNKLVFYQNYDGTNYGNLVLADELGAEIVDRQ